MVQGAWMYAPATGLGPGVLPGSGSAVPSLASRPLCLACISWLKKGGCPRSERALDPSVRPHRLHGSPP